MRKAITKRSVDALRPGQSIADTEIRGFIARCLPSRKVSYGLRYTPRNGGPRRWYPLGLHGNVTPDQARTQAREAAGRVAKGLDPHADAKEEKRQRREAETHTFDALTAEFIKRYAKPKLRTWAETERIFVRYFSPHWGERGIRSITRLDVTERLDAIEEGSGPVMADHALAAIRKLFAWHAARDDRFNSPIARGMARTKPSERARDRILSDAEIRALWKATEHKDVAKVFGPACRFILLSAQRPGECLRLRRRAIDAEGVWSLSAAEYKGKHQHHVPLSDAARAIVEAMPEPIREGWDYSFSTTHGRVPFSGRSKAKRKLDAAMLAALRETDAGAKLPPWVLHDLRRTARSLMSRAGVATDHAEQVLGHIVQGVRGIYDRHSYLNEKRSALLALAQLVERIVTGSDAVVVTLHRKAR